MRGIRLTNQNMRIPKGFPEIDDTPKSGQNRYRVTLCPWALSPGTQSFCDTLISDYSDWVMSICDLYYLACIILTGYDLWLVLTHTLTYDTSDLTLYIYWLWLVLGLYWLTWVWLEPDSDLTLTWLITVTDWLTDFTWLWLGLLY